MKGGINLPKERHLWIDIARGLSIIFVVLGHSLSDSAVNQYLYWFRMPLFFFVSGLLFKPIAADMFQKWATQKTKRLIIPYISYGLLITIVIFISSFNVMELIKNIIKLGYGGLVLVGPFGVFWFITVLLITQILFGFISRYSTRKQIIFIAASYILAHIVSFSPLVKIPLPWHVDVALLALTYYSMGFYFKQFILKYIQKKSLLFLSMILYTFFIFLDIKGVIHLELNMKYKIYQHIVLDFVVPMIIVFGICSICYWISKSKISSVLVFLGGNTVCVMYLHMPLNILVKNSFNIEYNSLFYILIGILIPLGIMLLLKKSPITAKLFLGIFPKKKNKENRSLAS